MHQIEKAVFSLQEGAGWTSLGQAIPAEEARDPAAIAARCGALYVLAPRDIYIKDADGNFITVPDRAAIVRDDNDHVTGIVSKNRYGLEYRQPKDIFEAFRDKLVAAQLDISHAAILAGGARVAVCALLPPDFSFTVGNKQDVVNQYITLSTGYDGKHGTLQTTGSIRVVCNNTLEYAIAMAMKAGKLRGIAASQRLEPDTLKKMIAGLAGDTIDENTDKETVKGNGLSSLIARAANSAKAQKKAFNAMANQKISAVQLIRYFGDVLEIDISDLDRVDAKGKPLVSTKSKNMITALKDGYEHAPGSQWAHGNVWGALNAVTHYATHAKTCRDTTGAGLGAARYASNLDGDAARMKARALVLAQSLLKVAA